MSAAKTKSEVESPETAIATLPNRSKVSRLEKKALATLDEAKKVVVKTAASYNLAAEFALVIKETERTIGELYDEHVEAAHKLHRGLTTARKHLLDPLSQARMLVQGAMSRYDEDQRRKAQAEAEALARKEREDELKEAAKLKLSKKEIAEIEAAPLEVAPISVPTPKVSGVVTKTVHTFKIVDESKVPAKFWIIDEAAIKAQVKLLGMACEIPGVEVIEEVQTQIRG